MRIGLRLEKPIGKHAVRPVALQCRWRRRRQLGLRDGPKTRRYKPAYPRPQIIRMHVERRRCGRNWHMRIGPRWFQAGVCQASRSSARGPLVCARYRSSKCISLVSPSLPPVADFLRKGSALGATAAMTDAVPQPVRTRHRSFAIKPKRESVTLAFVDDAADDGPLRRTPVLAKSKLNVPPACAGR